MKNINKIGLSIITTLLLGLSGCGGGGGGSSTTPPSTSTGYLVDANVSGVSYTSGSQSGTTDTSGKFTYEVGSKIIFTIGGVKLGEFDTSNIKSDKTIYPAELAGVDRNNTTDTKVLQIAQFLQSLDSDNNPDNGITINETVRTNLSGSTLDFTSGVVAQSDLNNTIQTVAQKTIRTQPQVLQHYRETLQTANITLPNLAPNTSSQTINTNEDVGYSFNSSVFTNGFSDIDGDTLTKIKITTLPTHGTLKLTDTNIALNDEINIADLAYITYTPNTNYHGIDSFKGLGYDGTVWSDETTMNITVASINDVPTITSSNTATVNENQTSALTIIATDVDNDTLIYSISGGDSGSFDINDSTGVVTFKVAPNFETKSSYTFSATASDGSATDTENITITVTNIPDVTPTLSNFTASINENVSIGTVVGTVTVSNSGDSTLTGFTLSDTTNFEINGSGTITTKTTLNYETNATYNLTVYATNGSGNSNNASVTINVIENLYIRSAVYDNNRTADVNDDKLYIYFNKDINPSSIATDTSANYDIVGTGAIGSSSSSEYNSSMFYQHTITQNSNGTASIAFATNGTTTIAIAPNTITSINNHPIDSSKNPAVEKFNIFAKLKTGKTQCFDDRNAENTIDCNDSHALKSDEYYASNQNKGIDRNLTRDDINEIITDNITRLMWQDDNASSSTTGDWNQAISYCGNLILGEYNDWRLPTIEELVSVSISNMTKVAYEEYWSNTSYASDTSRAWTLFASSQNIDSDFDKNSSRFIRCVRTVD